MDMRTDHGDTSSKFMNMTSDFMSYEEAHMGVLGNMEFAVEKSALQKMMAFIGNPPLELVLWNGQIIGCPGGSPLARVHIRDRGAMLKLMVNPEFFFGEMYTAQRLEVQGNLVDCLEAIYRALPSENRRSLWQKALSPFSNARRNTLPRARNNIHHHYDLGNDFYRLWLDKNMLYTCAYFPTPEMSLETSQIAKMDHVCRKLQLKPGDKVVEAGCGWGALAMHMARHYGATVQAYNISKEQIVYAREQALAENLDDRVKFIEDDYRNICGEYDAFVSVGMLEHVGVEHYAELGKVIDRSLIKEGRGLVHSIGRDSPRAMDAWIERYIFPGACPPSLMQMMKIFEPCGFSVLDVENLRLHYAKTLEHWLQRYEDAYEQVHEMFGETFVRTWRLYLAGSLASFRSGDTQLFQVLFARSGNNRIPWTREHLYMNRDYHGKL